MHFFTWLAGASLLTLIGASHELPSPHKTLSVAGYGTMVCGQDALNIDYDPKRPFIPTLIRMIFQALRAYEDIHSTFTEDRMLWNKWVSDEFNCENVQTWLNVATTPASDEAIQYFKRFAQKVMLPSLILKRSEFGREGAGSPPRLVIMENDAGLESYRRAELFQLHWSSRYEAIAVAVPVREKLHHESYSQIPHVLYLRELGSDKWTLIDEAKDSYLTDFPDARIAQEGASFVLYQSVDLSDDFLEKEIVPVRHYDLFMQKAYYIEELPMLKSLVRLICQIPLPSDSIISLNRTAFSYNHLAYLLKHVSPLTTLPELFLETVKLANAPIEKIQNFAEFNHDFGVYFPTPGAVLGGAHFFNQLGHFYRAVSFSVPKDPNNPNGPQLTFIRDRLCYNWTVYDDQNETVRLRVRHDWIVRIRPSAIVYRRISS